MSIMPPEPDSKTNSPRKAISRRLRFEILRRDDHACYYCHATDVPLTIDHVLPVALGGTDEPANLVAACKDCNGGKSSSSPDASVVAKVSDDAARWSAAMKLAAERMNQNKTATSELLKPFYDAWYVWSQSGWRYRLPVDAPDVLAQYLAAGMPPEVLAEAAEIALRKRGADNYWHYFQGVARNMLGELQRDAAAILSESDNHGTPDQDADFGWHNRAWRKGYLRALNHIQRAESGDPVYRETAPASAFQYGALAVVVDGESIDWTASR